MRHRVRSLLLLSAAVLGCGGPGSFQGKVEGFTLAPVADAIFMEGVGGVPGLTLFLSESPELCDRAKRNAVASRSSSLKVVLTYMEGDAAVAPEAGSYAVGAISGKMAGVVFVPHNEKCESAILADKSAARTGLVEVEKYEPGTRLIGRFDARLGQQEDEISGSFEAHFCEVPTFASPPRCD